MKQINVLFYHVPLSTPLSEVEKALDDDPILNSAIQHYSKELWDKEKIETFKLDRNMIVTENGYKLAFIESVTENENK